MTTLMTALGEEGLDPIRDKAHDACIAAINRYQNASGINDGKATFSLLENPRLFSMVRKHNNSISRQGHSNIPMVMKIAKLVQNIPELQRYSLLYYGCDWQTKIANLLEELGMIQVMRLQPQTSREES